MSGGTTAGIIIGSIVGVTAIVVGLYFLIRKQKRKKSLLTDVNDNRNLFQPETSSTTIPDTYYIRSGQTPAVFQPPTYSNPYNDIV